MTNSFLATADARSANGLQNSELRYRRLFESARDGILILDATTRKITDANPFMVQLLGYTHAEFLGKELWQIGLLKDEDASKSVVGQFECE
ncbi:MAG: PAS domain-containing protein [Pyrinomonadaceae bacterium]